MRINWFKDENHLVYINGATQLAELERTLHFPGLEEAANELRQHPTAEGFTIKGPKRTSGRLFVPDLTFGEHIEMGTVFVIHHIFEGNQRVVNGGRIFYTIDSVIDGYQANVQHRKNHLKILTH